MIEVVPTELKHIRHLFTELRDKDRKEIEALGLKVNPAISKTYKNAVIKKTALVNNEVAAIWGVCGTPLGNLGRPFLLTTPLCETIPTRSFIDLYLQEVALMNSIFPVLENYVDASYIEAVRLLRMAGFNFKDVIINDNLFYRFTKVQY
jgi:hypothetical protein